MLSFLADSPRGISWAIRGSRLVNGAPMSGLKRSKTNSPGHVFTEKGTGISAGCAMPATAASMARMERLRTLLEVIVGRRTIDRWHFSSHRTHVRRQLATMVDRMHQAHRQELVRRKVPHVELD